MNRLHSLTKLTPYPIHRTSPPLRRDLLIPLATLALAFTLFALSPKARAVTPAPDGGYPNFNTAEGDNALFNLTTGFGNTAIGFEALYSNATSGSNTAIGAYALYANTTGSNNTANGFGALGDNTTGFDNTANGHNALSGNTSGSENTADGDAALNYNQTGGSNTATGASALYDNQTGNNNTANGVNALENNNADNNTANGADALLSNTTGSSNTAEGFEALYSNTTGSNNIALGSLAGGNLTTGSNNIDIGNAGVAAESNTTRIGTSGTQTATFIAGIRGVAVAGGQPVGVSASGQLGIRASAARFKENIKPMDKASEALLLLQPVTFRYQKELDPKGAAQFGLVAEQVAKISPDLVVRDDHGKPFTVRYDEVNAMLLNEFLKEHRTVQEQKVITGQLQAAVLQQQKEIKALAASLQKVSNQLELTKPAPRLAEYNP